MASRRVLMRWGMLVLLNLPLRVTASDGDSRCRGGKTIVEGGLMIHVLFPYVEGSDCRDTDPYHHQLETAAAWTARRLNRLDLLDGASVGVRSYPLCTTSSSLATVVTTQAFTDSTDPRCVRGRFLGFIIPSLPRTASDLLASLPASMATVPEAGGSSLVETLVELAVTLHWAAVTVVTDDRGERAARLVAEAEYRGICVSSWVTVTGRQLEAFTDLSSLPEDAQLIGLFDVRQLNIRQLSGGLRWILGLRHPGQLAAVPDGTLVTFDTATEVEDLTAELRAAHHRDYRGENKPQVRLNRASTKPAETPPEGAATLVTTPATTQQEGSEARSGPDLPYTSPLQPRMSSTTQQFREDSDPPPTGSTSGQEKSTTPQYSSSASSLPTATNAAWNAKTTELGTTITQRIGSILWENNKNTTPAGLIPVSTKMGPTSVGISSHFLSENRTEDHAIETNDTELRMSTTDLAKVEFQTMSTATTERGTTHMFTATLTSDADSRTGQAVREEIIISPKTTTQIPKHVSSFLSDNSSLTQIPEEQTVSTAHSVAKTTTTVHSEPSETGLKKRQLSLMPRLRETVRPLPRVAPLTCSDCGPFVANPAAVQVVRAIYNYVRSLQKELSRLCPPQTVCNGSAALLGSSQRVLYTDTGQEFISALRLTLSPENHTIYRAGAAAIAVGWRSGGRQRLLLPPSDQKPASDQAAPCPALFTEPVRWKVKVWTTVLATLAAVGGVACLFFFVFYAAVSCRPLDHSQGWMAVLVAATAWQYAATAPYFLREGRVVCALRLQAPALALAAPLAVLLSRALSLAAAQTSRGTYGHVSGGLQAVLCFFILLVQVGVSGTSWLALHQATAGNTSHPAQCQQTHVQQLLSLTYVCLLQLLLLLLSPWMALSGRNYAEGPLTAASAWVSAAVWAGALTLYWLRLPLLDSETSTPQLCLGLVVSGSVSLWLVHLPRLFLLTRALGTVSGMVPYLHRFDGRAASAAGLSDVLQLRSPRRRRSTQVTEAIGLHVTSGVMTSRSATPERPPSLRAMELAEGQLNHGYLADGDDCSIGDAETASAHSGVKYPTTEM